MTSKPKLTERNVFPLSRHIGSRLRELRRHTGCSRDTLAAALGLTVSDLHELEDGNRQISLDQLQRFADALDVSVTTFFSDNAVAGDETLQNFLLQLPEVGESLQLLRAFTRIGDSEVRRKLIVQAEAAARS